MPKDIPVDDFDYAEYRKRVAQRIKSVRQLKGYPSYEVFAHQHDISRSQMNRYETGKGDLRLDSLLKVIRALDMTPAEFFSEGFDSW
jgi:transcriptional regulator with XRE-family HTH domain